MEDDNWTPALQVNIRLNEEPLLRSCKGMNILKWQSSTMDCRRMQRQ